MSEEEVGWTSILVLVDIETLAAASLTCHKLRRAAAAALVQLQADLSGGQEPYSIPCLNTR